MKVPEYIKKAARDMAKHSALANKNDEIIRNWMYKNNLLNDGNIDQLIDSCDQSNEPEGFIHHLETTPFEGNSKEYSYSYDED